MSRVDPALFEALARYNGAVTHCKPGRARNRWTRPRDPMIAEAEARWKAQQLERRERRERRKAHDT
jgi:hypothetical protein